MAAGDADALPLGEAGLQVVHVQEGVVPVQPHQLVLHPANSQGERDNRSGWL